MHCAGYSLVENYFRLSQIPSHQICCFYTLPPSPFLYLILSRTFIKKKKFPLSWLFLYLTSSCTSLSFSSLELPNLFIFLINYLIFSPTSLSLSPLELLDLFISPIYCTPNFLFKSCARIFFFSLSVVLMVLLLFESQQCVLSPLVSLFIFWCCMHLGALSCMSLWTK